METALVALGTLDEQGRPWTTIWGGERGFAQPVAQGVLGFNSGVDTKYDPVYEALWKETDGAGGMVRPNGGEGKLMSALSIDLESRDRVKLAGLMMAGSAEEKSVQMAMLVTESLGNCPKYLNKKRVSKKDVASESAVNGLPLSKEAMELIARSDMFFMSSTNGETMDTNHRGGPVGFIRVVSNDENEVALVYPEYSGNRLYQTLGNLKMNPAVGVVIPDYETSDVLYLTGTASILVGDEAWSILSRTNLAVKITVKDARFVKGGLPFQGTRLDDSPYNPPVRRLLSERDPNVVNPFERQNKMTANMIKREVLTPTINRFTFKLVSDDGKKLAWHAGQHLTLDFDMELGNGYAHMNDDDPQSLNEDFIRTFTISSPPLDDKDVTEAELQITMRKNGRATGFLWRHNERVPLELPVLGFGGESTFRMPTTAQEAKKPVFVAGGVGVTPLLAQAKAVLAGNVGLQVLWSISKFDVPLVVDAFKRIEGLAAVTSVFITGGNGDAEVKQLQELGVKAAEARRMDQGDVDGLKGETKFYLCAGEGLLKRLREWLDGQDVVWEDFGY
ncbi:hypothetical protein Golomagni_06127 [Golovinomyces magnicellulatus]|nr:hypothetical protein Golomagni_06127 [Golovinomyces magnicellulatus]